MLQKSAVCTAQGEWQASSSAPRTHTRARRRRQWTTPQLHRPSAPYLSAPSSPWLHGPGRPAAAICSVSLDEPSIMPTVAACVAAGTLGALLPPSVSAAADYLKPRKCTTCYGAGWGPCTVCHGRGKVGGLLEGAPSPGACTHCVHGRIGCSACGKTGLANAWLWSPAKDPGWGARGQ